MGNWIIGVNPITRSLDYSITQFLPEFFCCNPELRYLPSINHQNRNLRLVAGEQLGARGDIDHFEGDICQAVLLKHALNQALHVVTEMASRPGVDDDVSHFAGVCWASAAICSAAARGSAAATIGRPTTR